MSSDREFVKARRRQAQQFLEERAGKDPANFDLNNRPSEANPVIFEDQEHVITLNRLRERFVSSSLVPVEDPNDWVAIQRRNRQQDIELGLVD